MPQVNSQHLHSNLKSIMKIKSLSDLTQLSQNLDLAHYTEPKLDTLKAESSKVKIQHTVRVMLETKGRAGKGVSVIRGLNFDTPELQKLCKELKNLCGSGGTVKEQQIEIQGDHVQKIIGFFAQKNIVAKKAGS